MRIVMIATITHKPKSVSIIETTLHYEWSPIGCLSEHTGIRVPGCSSIVSENSNLSIEFALPVRMIIQSY